MVAERSCQALQACLERDPQYKQCHNDAFPIYGSLYYDTPYEMRTDKWEACSAEAVNADLWRYLNRWLLNQDDFPDGCIL